MLQVVQKKAVRHLRSETTYSTSSSFSSFSSGDWFPLCQATQGEAISAKTRLVPVKPKPRNFLTSSSNPARSQTELNLIIPADAKPRVGVIYPPTQCHSPGDEGNASTGLSSFRTSSRRKKQTAFLAVLFATLLTRYRQYLCRLRIFGSLLLLCSDTHTSATILSDRLSRSVLIGPSRQPRKFVKTFRPSGEKQFSRSEKWSRSKNCINFVSFDVLVHN